ncbi:MAG: EamA family transporter RarD [Myxococcota bacterium]
MGDARGALVPATARAPGVNERLSGAGVAAASAAYLLWGVLPAYWKLLGAVPPVEVLANRVLWSLLFTLALLGALGRLGDLRAALRSPRERLGLGAASVLIALNWGVFIWAVQAGRIVETSLGYYLNPLLGAALGVVLFRERLAPAQIAAFALAGAGVAIQIAAYGGVPWVALALAVTFTCYGVAKKRTRVSALASLAFETALLAPLALLWLAFGASAPGGALASGDGVARGLLLASGPITAAPLIAFAAAARRLPFSVLGLFQYVSPTLSLVLAVAVYGEPFTHAHAISFACIWLALALFSASAWRARRALEGSAT